MQNKTKKKKLVECEAERDNTQLTKRKVDYNMDLNDMNSTWLSYDLETYNPTYKDSGVASAYEGDLLKFLWCIYMF